MNNQYTQACNTSAAFGETNDCTVKAVAIVTNNDYSEAHQALAALGRKHGNGAYFSQWNGACEALGYSLHREATITARTVRTVVEQLEADKVYIIQSTAHVSAVVNGEVLDWAEGRLKRVKAVYQVLPTGVWPTTVDSKLLELRANTGWKVAVPQRGVRLDIWNWLDDNNSSFATFSAEDIRQASWEIELQMPHAKPSNIITEVRCWVAFHNKKCTV